MPELSETINDARSVIKRGALTIPGLWGGLDDMERVQGKLKGSRVAGEAKNIFPDMFGRCLDNIQSLIDIAMTHIKGLQ